VQKEIDWRAIRALDNKILRMLNRKTPLSSKLIAIKVYGQCPVGPDHRQVLNRLSRLVRIGKLRRVSRGLYIGKAT
jgi:hypothetical protein